jgi:hypothetical protein
MSGKRFSELAASTLSKPPPLAQALDWHFHSGRIIFSPAQELAEDSAINKKAAPDNSEAALTLFC